MEKERKIIWNLNKREEKLMFYINEIQNIVEQLLSWIDIKTCKCSYYPLRLTVEAAINGELWENYRNVKTCLYTISELANYILSSEEKYYVIKRSNKNSKIK